MPAQNVVLDMASLQQTKTKTLSDYFPPEKLDKILLSLDVGDTLIAGPTAAYIRKRDGKIEKVQTKTKRGRRGKHGN